MTNIMRHRLGSIGDSTPRSDSSEGTGSDTCELPNDWNTDISGQQNGLYLNGDEIPDDNFLVDEDKAKVESFYSGLGTEVAVCSSLANLYENVKNQWRLIHTGIPVLLYDKGSARSRNIPRVSYILAERGTGFPLWQDIIDNLSDYKVASPSFHTMCLSSDHTKLIGFSFDSSQSAHDLWSSIEKLISNPENISLSGPGRKKRKAKKPVRIIPVQSKSQISNPIQFNHVTKVTADDAQRYLSFQMYGMNQVH